MAGRSLAAPACQRSLTIADWTDDPPAAPYPDVTLCAGGSITFRWASRHGVATTPSPDCPPSWTAAAGVKELAPLAPRGNYTWAAPAAGPATVHFAYQVSNHCASGQKFTAQVV